MNSSGRLRLPRTTLSYLFGFKLYWHWLRWSLLMSLVRFRSQFPFEASTHHQNSPSCCCTSSREGYPKFVAFPAIAFASQLTDTVIRSSQALRWYRLGHPGYLHGNHGTKLPSGGPARRCPADCSHCMSKWLRESLLLTRFLVVWILHASSKGDRRSRWSWRLKR